MNGIVKNRLPLLLLAVAALFKITGVLFHNLEASLALDFIFNAVGGGMLLFLFPTFSFVFRKRPEGFSKSGELIFLSSVLNPLVLIIIGLIAVAFGVTLRPWLLMAFAIIPAIALEFYFVNDEKSSDKSPWFVTSLAIALAAALLIIVFDASVYKITEDKFMPDHAYEQFSNLDFSSAPPAWIKREPKYLGEPVKYDIRRSFRQEIKNEFNRAYNLDLRWLINNKSKEELFIDFFVDNVKMGEYKVPALFDPGKLPRNYPTSNLFIHRTVYLAPGMHQIEIKQKKTNMPLALYDLTGLDKSDFYEFFNEPFKILDMGDIQQIFDAARMFNNHILPHVSIYSYFTYDEGGISIIDLPLYHQELNLALNLISDDMAGANALYIWYLFWIIAFIIMIFFEASDEFLSKRTRLVLGVLIAWALAASIWRMEPPCDEGLFLDMIFAHALVALVYFARKDFQFAMAICAFIAVFVRRAGQPWMLLTALGFIIFHPERFKIAIKVFALAGLVSAGFWFCTASGIMQDHLKDSISFVLQEDIGGRFFYFNHLLDPSFLTQTLWLKHGFAFLVFIFLGTGGLIVAAFYAGKPANRALAFGTVIYMLMLSSMTYHRINYAATIIIAVVALGLSVSEDIATSSKSKMVAPALIYVAVALLCFNTLRLLDLSDDYTQTESDDTLVYSTFPGYSARWQILRGGYYMKNGKPNEALEHFSHAAFLYPYFLSDVSFFQGRAALALNDFDDALDYFRQSSYLEGDKCVTTISGALLLSEKGQLNDALKLVTEKEACAKAADLNYYKTVLQKISAGGATRTPDIEKLYANIPSEDAFRAIDIQKYFGWPGDIPPIVPLPKK